MKDTVLDRLLRYVKIDTQSRDDVEKYPSTAKQFDLLKLLLKELQDLGMKDVSIDKYGYVMATLPGNLPHSHPAFGKVPVVGFIAHVDTSPSTSGENVKPQVIQKYQEILFFRAIHQLLSASRRTLS
jgi:tripeptide aminopeptidase